MVKMVNLLPVSVQATIDLKGIIPENTEAVKTVLTGAPDDKNAKPEISTCKVSEDFKLELPAYSFTVVKMKIK